MTFFISFGGIPKVSNLAANKRSMQRFMGLLSTTVERINGVVDGFPRLTNDMRRLDPAFKQYGEVQLKNFQNKFIQNPRQWPRLEPSAIKIRRYKLNPNELKNDILDASRWTTVEMGGEDKYVPVNLQTKNKGNLEPILSKFFSSLPKITPSREASVTPRNPVLLFTGALKNSLDFTYRKRTFKGKNSTTFRRGFEYFVSSSYAETHFTGGVMDTPVLIIKRRSQGDARRKFEFKFIIPIQYAKYFRKLNLGPDYEVSIEMKRTRVHARDPFIFTKSDEKDFNDFQFIISEEIQTVEYGKVLAEVSKELKRLK